MGHKIKKTLVGQLLTVFDPPDALSALSYPLEVDLCELYWSGSLLWLLVGFSKWEAMAEARGARGEVQLVVGSGCLPPPKATAPVGQLCAIAWAPFRICSSPLVDREWSCSHSCQPRHLTPPGWFPSTPPTPFVNILFLKPPSVPPAWEGALDFLLGS